MRSKVLQVLKFFKNLILHLLVHICVRCKQGQSLACCKCKKLNHCRRGYAYLQQYAELASESEISKDATKED